jgi:hypothetical protein
MLTFIYVYLSFSLLIGLMASVGFLYNYELCRCRWWYCLMLVCPLSWLSVAAFSIAYGFYKRREMQKGGTPC